MSGRLSSLDHSPGDAPLKELLGRLGSDLGDLVRQEAALARLEAKQELKRAGQAAGMMAAAGVVGVLALLLASFALVKWIDEAVHHAVAFALVAALWAVAAAVLLGKARERVKEIDLASSQTVATIKEDIEWTKTRTN
jgi:hypothetical protein